MMHAPRPVRIAVLYAVFGGLWILTTDTLVEWVFAGETSLAAAQTAKGLVYIGATTLLVYWLAKRDGDRTARDVRRMRETQESLRQQESRWRALIDASPHAIFSLDLDGRVQTGNQAAERIFGWSAEEVQGRPLPIVPEESEEEFRQLRQEVARGRRISGLELVRQRRDGTPIHVRLSAAPIPGDDGTPRGHHGAPGGRHGPESAGRDPQAEPTDARSSRTGGPPGELGVAGRPGRGSLVRGTLPDLRHRPGSTGSLLRGS